MSKALRSFEPFAGTRVCVVEGCGRDGHGVVREVIYFYDEHGNLIDRQDPCEQGETMEQCDGDVCMVYDEHGNALRAFDYTPETLEAEAQNLRAAVTLTRSSPWVVGTNAATASQPSQKTE